MFLLLFLYGLFALVLAEFAFRSHIIKRRVSKLQRAACAVGGLEYICILVYVPKASSCAQKLSVPGSFLRQKQKQKNITNIYDDISLPPTYFYLLLIPSSLIAKAASSTVQLAPRLAR